MIEQREAAVVEEAGQGDTEPVDDPSGTVVSAGAVVNADESEDGA